MILTRYTALLLFFLILSGSSLYAQNTLNPYRIMVFRDGAQITQKGILRFSEQKASIDPVFDFIPESIGIANTSEFEVEYVKFRLDTVFERRSVANWRELIQANKGNEITVTFQIGEEYDDLSGVPKIIDPEGDIFVLRSSTQKDFFIPYKQVRQIMLDTVSNYSILKAVSRPVVEVKMNKDLPFAPVEMNGTVESFSWRPDCQFTLVSDNAAIYTGSAIISNKAGDFEEVEITVSAKSLENLAHPEKQNSEQHTVGTFSLAKGESIMSKFEESKHEYDISYTCIIPWEGIGPENKSIPQAVLSNIELTNPVQPSSACNSLRILNPDNRILGVRQLEEGKSQELKYIDLNASQQARVRYQEKQGKKFPKTVKIDDREYEKIEIKAKLFVENMSPEKLNIRIVRQVKGEMTDVGSAQWDQGPKPTDHKLIWNEYIPGGKTEDFQYSYVALIPVDE